ncbi:T9SS type A sorting domain-containing protein [Flavobacterium sp.]|uniref:T9SS type A sorting domain-containing protein n=1 Tax=Flavobacterium sp. TaxID=239 RepID=UPI00286DFA5D|nr:T9SS type A sorting domain-containing protein [Flavobacterium sp.]
MRYTLQGILTILTLQFCLFSAQAQDILWEKSYGGKHAEFLFDAVPTPDYGFILAGSSISNKNGNKSDNNKGDLDYWVWKMDEKGDLDWQKSFGGAGVDLLQSIKLTKDAGFILAGTSTSNSGEFKTQDSKGDADFWIIKLDAKGGEMWQKTIGGNGQEKLQSISRTTDGGYIIGGSSASDKTPKDEKGTADKYGKTENSQGNLDYWVIKLKENGDIEWQKTIGGEYIDELKSIEQTKDGGYILGGYSNSPVSGNKTDKNIGVGDYWIVKLDKIGTIEWQKTVGGDQDDNLFALTQTNDGGFIAGGNSNSGATDSKSKGNSNGTDFWVVKFDEKGEILWQETYNYGKTDVLTSIVENTDGTLLIGGYAQSEVDSQKTKDQSAIGMGKKTDKEGISDYIALKITAKGEEIWSQTVGSKGEEVLKKLLETRDGGYLLAGTSQGEKSRDKNTAIGGSDFWVVKLKDKTKLEKVKIKLEVLPNPVVTFTNVIVNFEYTSGEATLYDLNGRQLNQSKIHGEHTIPFDMSALPSGLYIIDIKTNGGQEGIKVIKQ